MHPTVSVIIPTFNRKTLVREAIASVRSQTYTDYEVIVVDDGSSDGTVAYLGSLNLPVQILEQQNSGVASARNLGIKASLGRLIAFLDSDDLWLPDKLQTQVTYLQTHPEMGLVYCDEYITDGGKDSGKTRFSINPPRHKLSLPAFVDLAPIHTSAVMIRKSVLDEIGPFNEVLEIHEDSDLWNRVSEKYDLGFIEKPLVTFRWEMDSIHLMRPDKRDRFINAGKKYLEAYKAARQARGLSTIEREAIAKSYEIIADMERAAGLITS